MKTPIGIKIKQKNEQEKVDEISFELWDLQTLYGIIEATKDHNQRYGNEIQINIKP